jgi:hypothetical protein
MNLERRAENIAAHLAAMNSSDPERLIDEVRAGREPVVGDATALLAACHDTKVEAAKAVDAAAKAHAKLAAARAEQRAAEDAFAADESDKAWTRVEAARRATAQADLRATRASETAKAADEKRSQAAARLRVAWQDAQRARFAPEALAQKVTELFGARTEALLRNLASLERDMRAYAVDLRILGAPFGAQLIAASRPEEDAALATVRSVIRRHIEPWINTHVAPHRRQHAPFALINLLEATNGK